MLAAMLALDFPTELGAPGQQLFCQQDNCPAISTMDMYVCDITFLPFFVCLTNLKISHVTIGGQCKCKQHISCI